MYCRYKIWNYNKINNTSYIVYLYHYSKLLIFFFTLYPLAVKYILQYYNNLQAILWLGKGFLVYKNFSILKIPQTSSRSNLNWLEENVCRPATY